MKTLLAAVLAALFAVHSLAAPGSYSGNIEPDGSGWSTGGLGFMTIPIVALAAWFIAKVPMVGYTMIVYAVFSLLYAISHGEIFFIIASIYLGICGYAGIKSVK